jgi:hypothetical protein
VDQSAPGFEALAETLNEIRQYVVVPFRATWRLAAHDGDRITFITDVDEDWYYATIEDGEAGWHFARGGDCRVRRAIAGELSVATWWLDPRLPPPAADATVVDVMVEEQECASGSYATGRIGNPIVEYAEDTLTMTIGVRSVGGLCPSNPSTPAVVILPEPLGARELLDGSYIPARPPLPPN